MQEIKISVVHVDDSTCSSFSVTRIILVVLLT